MPTTVPARQLTEPLRVASRALLLALLMAFALSITGFALSGLAALTTMLTLFVAVIVSAFGTRYLRADPNRSAFATRLIALVGFTILFVTAPDVVSLGIGWIGAGVAMAALIGHIDQWDEAKAARRRAIVHFAIADLSLLAALGLLAMEAGSTRIDDIVAHAAARSTGFSLAAFLLVVAALVRCAVPPFSRWLTRSMAAPTPVSALMHAGFVNAGGILLIRFGPVLEQAPRAQLAAVAAGAFAALWGSATMLVRPDVKRSLAGSTVAQMGFMLMSCGLGAYAAACWHLIAHGLFKAWLFLSSGSAIGHARSGAVDRSVAPLALATLAALVTVLVCLRLQTDPLAPAAVPTILAVATAAAALPRFGRAPLTLLPGIALLLLYLGGFSLTEAMLPRPVGTAPGGAGLTALLIGLFFIGWAVQWRLSTQGRGLPARLHARLLNS